MKKFFTRRKLNIIISVASVAAMWIVWIIVYYAVGNDYIIPSFQDTFVSMWRYFGDPFFWRSFGRTLLRTLEAFALSFALAAIFAVVGSLCRGIKVFLNPVMIFLRTLPTLAVILIILVSAAVGATPDSAPIAVTFLVLFPMIYSQFSAAIDGIDGETREMLKAFGVPRAERIFKVYVPLVSPSVFSQLGANFSLGIKIMISAEVLANTFLSLGGLMQDARMYSDMAALAALTLLAVAVGLIADVALSQLSRINSKWQRGSAE